MSFPSISQVVLRRSTVVAVLAIALAAVSSAASAQSETTGPMPPPPPPPPGFGIPLPGLTADQLAAFEDGKEDFAEVETRSGGLGPIFNRDSCAACHSVPALGGSSNVFVTRFGRSANGAFDPLTSLGGLLLQERAIDPSGLEHVPREANVTAKRQSTPLFGLGLIEAIPDATILRGVRATPVDGVLGKASMVLDIATRRTLVGRFGWKGQQATLLSFAGDAYLNEMGITNRLFPTENAPNGNLALLRRLDTVRDPEDQPDPDSGKAGIDVIADFMRFLGPPPTQPVTASNTFGAKLFMDVSCTSCHTPVLFTGASPIPALNNKAVLLYSDLLLHDMGALGDGIVQGSAGAREMKTPPLWGLRASGPYLHDGRANTIEDAIRAHDGEAKVAKDRFLRLTPDQQALLVEFLKSI